MNDYKNANLFCLKNSLNSNSIPIFEGNNIITQKDLIEMTSMKVVEASQIELIHILLKNHNEVLIQLKSSDIIRFTNQNCFNGCDPILYATFSQIQKISFDYFDQETENMTSGYLFIEIKTATKPDTDESEYKQNGDTQEIDNLIKETLESHCDSMKSSLPQINDVKEEEKVVSEDINQEIPVQDKPIEIEETQPVATEQKPDINSHIDDFKKEILEIPVKKCYSHNNDHITNNISRKLFNSNIFRINIDINQNKEPVYSIEDINMISNPISIVPKTNVKPPKKQPFLKERYKNINKVNNNDKQANDNNLGMTLEQDGGNIDFVESIHNKVVELGKIHEDNENKYKNENNCDDDKYIDKLGFEHATLTKLDRHPRHARNDASKNEWLNFKYNYGNEQGLDYNISNNKNIFTNDNDDHEGEVNFFKRKNNRDKIPINKNENKGNKAKKKHHSIKKKYKVINYNLNKEEDDNLDNNNKNSLNIIVGKLRKYDRVIVNKKDINHRQATRKNSNLSNISYKSNKSSSSKYKANFNNLLNNHHNNQNNFNNSLPDNNDNAENGENKENNTLTRKDSNTKQVKICRICLEKIKKLTKLNNCHHEFCHECISEWAQVSNTCPICKKEFSKLSNRHEVKNIRRKRLKMKEEEEEPWMTSCMTHCMVCKKSTDEYLLLVCDKCHYNVCHTYCDGLDMIPDGEWICSKCRNKNTSTRRRGGLDQSSQGIQNSQGNQVKIRTKPKPKDTNSRTSEVDDEESNQEPKVSHEPINDINHNRLRRRLSKKVITDKDSIDELNEGEEGIRDDNKNMNLLKRSRRKLISDTESINNDSDTKDIKLRPLTRLRSQSNLPSYNNKTNNLLGKKRRNNIIDIDKELRALNIKNIDDIDKVPIPNFNDKKRKKLILNKLSHRGKLHIKLRKNTNEDLNNRSRIRNQPSKSDSLPTRSQRESKSKVKYNENIDDFSFKKRDRNRFRRDILHKNIVRNSYWKDIPYIENNLRDRSDRKESRNRHKATHKNIKSSKKHDYLSVPSSDDESVSSDHSSSGSQQSSNSEESADSAESDVSVISTPKTNKPNLRRSSTNLPKSKPKLRMSVTTRANDNNINNVGLNTRKRSVKTNDNLHSPNKKFKLAINAKDIDSDSESDIDSEDESIQSSAKRPKKSIKAIKIRKIVLNKKKYMKNNKKKNKIIEDDEDEDDKSSTNVGRNRTKKSTNKTTNLSSTKRDRNKIKVDKEIKSILIDLGRRKTQKRNLRSLKKK